MKKFTDRSLSLAPGLAGKNKINFGLIIQAFKLREKTSVSLFFFYMYLCFWLCIIGFMTYTGIALILGDKLISMARPLADPNFQKYHKLLFLFINLGYLLLSSIATSFIIIISSGYLWRYHIGKKKRFFATLPSFTLFIKMLFISIFFVCGVLIIASLAFFVLFKLYYLLAFFAGIGHHYVNHEILSYPILGIEAIVALFYWLSCSYMTCVLFKKYQQEKCGDSSEITSFISCFVKLFKPFFKQSVRFVLVILSLYLIVLSPFLILGKYFIAHQLSPRFVFWGAVIYLFLTPTILSTMFNLYLLCFQSIMNYAPNTKNKASKNKADKNRSSTNKLSTQSTETNKSGAKKASTQNANTSKSSAKKASVKSDQKAKPDT